ncbi:MAG: hypothetical protein JNG84_09805 [Archangium sp.]|nr:hypothetical protein [Archangium sp.]
MTSRRITSSTRPVTTPPKPAAPALKAADVARDAQALHAAMHTGLVGAGTNETAIFEVLERANPVHLDAVKAQYKAHYGRDLDNDLKKDLSGVEQRRARALLSGDVVGAAVEVLRAESGSIFSRDADELIEALEVLPPDQRAAVAARFQRETGDSLESRIKRTCRGSKETEALAFLNNQPSVAYAARLERQLGTKRSPEDAIEVLQRTHPASLPALATAYQKHTGRSLESDLTSSLKGPKRERALALLQADPVGATAAQLRDLADGGFLGFGKDGAGALALLEQVPPDQRAALTADYQKRYGRSLHDELVKRFGGRDEKRLVKALDGTLDDVERLRIAVKGAGTDSTAILAVLKDRTPSDAAALKAAYFARTGTPLEKDLTGDLTGRDEFEALLALEGTPQTPEAAVDQARRRRDFERAGVWNTISRLLMNVMSRDGQRLDRTVEQAEQALANAVRDGVIDDAERSTLEGLTTLAGGDVEAYRASKESVTNAVATGAAVAVAVATAGAGTGLVAATVIGASTRVAVRGAMAGKSYSFEDAAVDVTKGAIDGLAGGVAGKFATAAGPTATLAAKLSRAAVAGAGTGFVGAVTDNAAKATTWNEGVTEGLFDLGTKGVKGAARGAVNRVVTTWAKELIANARNPLGVIKTAMPDGELDLSKYEADEATRAALKATLGDAQYDQLYKTMADLKLANPELANISIDDLVAMRAYTGAFYREMNSGLRGTTPETLTKLAPLIKTAASGLNKLPSYVGTVYRGASLTPDKLARYLAGETIAEKAFLSTSTDKTTAFGGNVLFVIDAKSNGKPVKVLSQFARENEVLFGPGTEFKVLSSAFDATVGKHVIMLQEVP